MLTVVVNPTEVEFGNVDAFNNMAREILDSTTKERIGHMEIVRFVVQIVNYETQIAVTAEIPNLKEGPRSAEEILEDVIRALLAQFNWALPQNYMDPPANEVETTIKQ